MKSRRLTYFAILVLIISMFAGPGARQAAADSGIRQIPLAGTGRPVSASTDPGDGLAGPETPAGLSEPARPNPFNGVISPSLAGRGGHGSADGSQSDNTGNDDSRPTATAGFEGLNHFQQRYSNRGNQFSLEPPDQALCVGNGYVVESTNDVFNVYNSAGVSQLPDNTSTNVVAGFPTNVNHTVDLNSFYGYPPAINRSTGIRSQFITDPSCLYDAASQRFFLVVLTLEVKPNGKFTLHNHLDIAVSATSNPTGLWKIYRVDVTGDGSNPDPANACPCLGDYPHIGADKNGFYITTNAYPWLGNGFDGAQLYAFSKAQLVAGAAVVTMQHIDTFGMVNAPSDAGPTQPGFTVWPAQSPGTGSFESAAGGTEYFLSSNAADEAKRPVSGTGGDYTSRQIVVWALTNTSSLNTVPALSLTNTLVGVRRYALPPKSDQPGTGGAPGTNVPLGHCINDTTTPTIAGPGCWKLLVGAPGNEVVSPLDSNDTRMQQVTFANGQLWGALDTAVSFDRTPAHNKAGVAWYVVEPTLKQHGRLAARIAREGTLGVPGANIIYPAIGVTAAGQGVMAVTLVGPSNNPSAAYATINADQGVGPVRILAAGAAPQDGFSGYNSQAQSGVARPRWGDYGAAAVDGNTIWIASEYIAQPCDYTAWGGRFFGATSGDNKLGTCAASPGAPGARTALANWSTRISAITYPADNNNQSGGH